MSESTGLFLGLDSSTQGLKCTIIDAGLNIVYERAINFDRELPQFETKGGVQVGADGLTVTSPAMMWVAAVDLLFARMRADGAPLDRVCAISGSGQQHGSVWLNGTARARLQGLAADQTLEAQLAGVFSVANSPGHWQASSVRLRFARDRRISA